MIFAMLYHKTYCNKINYHGSFCKQFFVTNALPPPFHLLSSSGRGEKNVV